MSAMAGSQNLPRLVLGGVSVGTMNLYLPLPIRRVQPRVKQAFGANAEAYARYGMRGHNGLDFETAAGEVVVAVDDGEVVEVRLDATGYGVTVKLSHPWGESRYAHGQRLSVPIEFSLGHVVHQGERVFLAGGHVHLGLRIRRDDGSLDYSNTNGFWGYDDPLPHLGEAVVMPAPTRVKKAA